MHVIMDLEWFETKGKHVCPTQIAALRVDENWNTTSVFFELICPQSGLEVPWNHIAFSGAETDLFLRAKSTYAIFGHFENWLQPDDVLCWWRDEPADTLSLLMKAIRKDTLPNEQCRLRQQFTARVNDGKSIKGSPYSLAQKRGLSVSKPEHCAINDVKVIQQLMKYLGLSTKMLSMPLPCVQTTNKIAEQFPYWYDESTNIVHTDPNCSKENAVARKGIGTIKTCIAKHYKPCPICCGEKWRADIRSYNLKHISQRDCRYFYFSNSTVFHRATCHLILSAARSFDGAIYYDTCIASGRTPCKICKPVPGLFVPYTSMNNTDTYPQKEAWLRKHEQRAIEKREKSIKERNSINLTALSSKERHDIITLTSPIYAFWAGRGYTNFHLRSCRKLQGLEGIRGFGSYQQAINAGYLPCRDCKPTPKQSLQISMPYDTAAKSNETLESVLAQCTRLGIRCTYEKPYIIISTAIANWRINIKRKPVIIEHRPKERADYHIQHKMFLSFSDAVWYICKHDQVSRPSL